jgi:hypothetical protein
VARFEASGWSGIVAPRNTPVEIVEKLRSESGGVDLRFDEPSLGDVVITI